MMDTRQTTAPTAKNRTGEPMIETSVYPTKTREMHNHPFDSTIWNNLEFRDDDIVISAYAKSGTTWTQQIVAQLLSDPDLEVAEMSPWLDLRVPPKEIKLPMVEAQTHRRFLKTHPPGRPGLLREGEVHLHRTRRARRGLEHVQPPRQREPALVRPAQRHAGARGTAHRASPGDIRQYFRDWMDRDGHPFWPPWENVRTWWEFRHLPNVLFVHFANLKRDMPREMRRIAEFLDVPIDETHW
jgi:aryl sulfotransferase